MKLALFFAKRYLFSKKSVNAINLISTISMVGVMVSSAALVSILSFYNGLEKIILTQFSEVVSDFRLEPSKGKTFDLNQKVLKKMKEDPLVSRFEPVIQEKVLVQRGNYQVIADLKGVSLNYLEGWKNDDASFLNEGFVLQEYGLNYAIVGAEIDQNLNIPYERSETQITLYSPRKERVNSLNPIEEFNVMNIYVSGVMGARDYLNNLVLVPLDFAQEFLDEPGFSAIEIEIHDEEKTSEFLKKWDKELGEEFNLLTKEDQNSTLYKVIKSEKWAIFAILTFTGIIAILNIIASLTMLVMDKRKDIAVLKGLGANSTLIRRIFFYQGMLISLIGSVVGLTLGFLLAFSQQKWGWLSFAQAENMIVEAYPVDIRATDFILVFLTIFLLSLFISNIASRLSLKSTHKLS